MHTNCKDCDSRYEGCQDRCPSLFAKKLIEDEEKVKREKEKLIDDQQFRGIERSVKKRNRA